MPRPHTGRAAPCGAARFVMSAATRPLADAGPGVTGRHRVELVDVDDVEPGQTHLEGVHVIFEVDDLQASFLQLVELGGEELLEAHDPNTAALVEERLNLREEVGIVAGQDDVTLAKISDRIHRALQTHIDDLHVGGS